MINSERRGEIFDFAPITAHSPGTAFVFLDQVIDVQLTVMGSILWYLANHRNDCFPVRFEQGHQASLCLNVHRSPLSPSPPPYPPFVPSPSPFLLYLTYMFDM